MIRIRDFRENDLKPVAELYHQAFSEFVIQPDAPAEVRERFLGPLENVDRDPATIRKRLRTAPYLAVAVEDGTVVGVARGFAERLVNLFVDKHRHRAGLGRRMLLRFEDWCRTKDGTEVRLRASLNAVGFYTRMGYRKTTGIRMFHGLRIQPMRKRLAPHPAEEASR